MKPRSVLVPMTVMGGVAVTVVEVVDMVAVGDRLMATAFAVHVIAVVGVVDVGEGVQVLLGGGESGVAHAVFEGLQVCAAGEEPGCVGVAEVVDAAVAGASGGVECRLPDFRDLAR